SQWGIGGAVLLGAFFWFAGPWIIDLMSTEPDVRMTARAYLFWVALAPIIGIASWMFDGIFIGATLSREMRNTMLVSVAIYGVALLALTAVWGNHGLWAALMVLNTARAITMAMRYRNAERAAS
ncbi:MAG: MATE family efflux transporter, partial [Albidovulum sp.]